VDYFKFLPQFSFLYYFLIAKSRIEHKNKRFWIYLKNKKIFWQHLQRLFHFRFH